MHILIFLKVISWCNDVMYA